MLHPKAWYEIGLPGCCTYELLIIPFAVTEFLVVSYSHSLDLGLTLE